MEELAPSVVAGAHTARRLRLAGVARTSCAAPPWTQAHPGRYAFAATDPHHPRQRALVGASVLPSDGALGGWAAAYLQGAGRLDGSTADPDRFEPVLLCMPRRCQRQWWPGLRPFRSELDADDVVVVDGVRVTSPLRTAFDLGRLAPSDTEAVVVLDAAAAGLGVDLAGWRRTRGRTRGGAARPGSVVPCGWPTRGRGSAQESRFRVLWQVDAGSRDRGELARPRPGRAPAGGVDLLDVEAGVVGEYDGGTTPPRTGARSTTPGTRCSSGTGCAWCAWPVATSRAVGAGRCSGCRVPGRDGLRRDRALDRWFADPVAPSVDDLRDPPARRA